MKRFRTMLLVIAGVFSLLMAASQVRAQVDEAVRPPRVEQPAKAPSWLYYLVGVGAIVVCVGLAVFPGRRSHED